MKGKNLSLKQENNLFRRLQEELCSSVLYHSSDPFRVVIVEERRQDLDPVAPRDQLHQVLLHLLFLL
jgi:hypothetical protein